MTTRREFLFGGAAILTLGIGGVAIGGAMAVVGFGGVRSKSAGPRVIHDDPRSVRRR